jgi:hypothetical protein
MTAADAQYSTNGGSWRDVVVGTLIIVGWLPARRQRLLGEVLTSAEGQQLNEALQMQKVRFPLTQSF